MLQKLGKAEAPAVDAVPTVGTNAQVDGLPEGYITLVEAATRLFEALRNTKLGEFYESLSEDFRGMTVLDSFSSPFIEYCPLKVKRPPSRQWEDYTKERFGPMTAHGKASYLARLGSREPFFVEPVLREIDADGLITEFRAGADMNPV